MKTSSVKHLTTTASTARSAFDFFNYYYQYVTSRNPYSDGYAVPSAYQIFHVNTPVITKVANDPNDPTQLPEPGDVLVFARTMPGSGGHGHVAVVATVSPIGYTVYEQNWGGMFVKKNTRAWNGHEMGWIKFNAFNQGGDKPMSPQEEANAYRIVLGREIEHGGSGRSGYKFIIDAEGELANKRNAERQHLATVEAQTRKQYEIINELSLRPNKEEYVVVVNKLTDCTSELLESQAALKRELEAPPVIERVEVIKEVETWPSWIPKIIQDLLTKFFKKGA